MKNFTSTSCGSKGDNGLICEVVDDNVKGESCILLLFQTLIILRIVRTKYFQKKVFHQPRNFCGIWKIFAVKININPKNMYDKNYMRRYTTRHYKQRQLN
jgi:hypothetical protein